MEKAIEALNNAANLFIEIASQVTLSKQIYDDGWKAKEIIAHIVFYHEYYASVVDAIVKNKQDLPLIDESLATVNRRSAKEESKYSRETLISRFKVAQSAFAKSLMKLESTTKIPYKKGGRIYKTIDYIEEITRHIARHTKDLVRRKRVG